MESTPIDLAELTLPPGVDRTAGVAYMDGELMPVGAARLPILDWGLTRSDATYDVVHVWKGAFFRLDDHLDRFLSSCGGLRLDPKLGREDIRSVLMACVRASGLRDAYVEMACTRGVPPPGVRDPSDCDNRFFAFAIPFVWVLSEARQDAGAKLHISDVPRIGASSVDPTIKNFHWGDLTRGLFQAMDLGADTAVLVDAAGFLTEGPGFNVFAVKGGRVTTPGAGVLEGITRASVRELCEAESIEFSMAAITPGQLLAADEVFISSTAGGIMPVSYVNNRVLGMGRPGPLSRRLRELYWQRHEEGWHATSVDYG
ncbi:MAG: branched-chain amino acid--2-keto-4-methylthiobutyrate aminotransferase [Chromatiales bacterium]|jgi:branched-chain amino acid aminotransferase|nr:branched-chain amino acid--2-keto-4-methylthiobutyrate aminotransferase [Chromatiales bacterium]